LPARREVRPRSFPHAHPDQPGDGDGVAVPRGRRRRGSRMDGRRVVVGRMGRGSCCHRRAAPPPVRPCLRGPPMSDLAVRLDDVGKRYIKYEDAPALLTSIARMRQRTKRSHLWAVRHLDLDVTKGETVGIIGRNGSGKTTTLRMLAGVTGPTE